MAHLFAAVSHIPPAFSQSAFVMNCEKSPDVEPELGDGLAEGEAPEPLGEVEEPLDAPPDVELPPLPVPEVPAGAPEPEPPAAPVPLPLPLLLCAATSAGVSAKIATSTSPNSLVIVQTPFA